MSARVPSRSKARTWLAYRVRGPKAELLGHVDAPDEAAAIAAAAEEYHLPPERILVRRGLVMPERRRPLRRGEIIGEAVGSKPMTEGS